MTEAQFHKYTAPLGRAAFCRAVIRFVAREIEKGRTW